MNTHKAHFPFLPVPSSGCEARVRPAAKLTEECLSETEMAATSNKTVDFDDLEYRLYSWM